MKKAAATVTKRSRPARSAGVASPSSVNRRLRLVEGKRGAILEAALACFSRLGLHGTSVDQVAARADVSKSNLLYYFSSKEDLYIAVLKDLLSLWLAPLRALQVDQEPIAAIKEYIRLKLLISRDHPQASRLFCLEMIQGAPLLRSELEQSLRDIVEQKSQVISTWVAQGKLNPIDPHHLIFALWAMTQHYADFSVQVESLTGHTLDDAGFFDRTLTSIQTIVLRGIGAVEPTATTRPGSRATAG